MFKRLFWVSIGVGIGLVNEFNATRRAREAELNSKYAARNE